MKLTNTDMDYLLRADKKLRDISATDADFPVYVTLTEFRTNSLRDYMVSERVRKDLGVEKKK
jgi:hypothetical protein